MLAISGSGSHAHITEISPSDIQGTAGKDGPQGFHGAKGPPGPPGPTGHQGAIGTTGEPGDIAPDSADGDQGPPVSINCSAAFIHSRAHEERGGGAIGHSMQYKSLATNVFHGISQQIHLTSVVSPLNHSSGSPWPQRKTRSTWRDRRYWL